MAGTIHKLILTVGFLSMFHAAYSAAQHHSYLRLNELEFTRLPFDIILQAITSLFMIMYAVLNLAGEFKEIRASADLDNKSWETFRNVPSFYTFCHRGQSLLYQNPVST
ncbi:unnamed protein product [Ceutorhynchus assimilis]|uniref:Membrane magnesium transporter n=1 Tax=Ceutorhynchus assimilis TaxID=467358 RepID=A0A9N9MJH2_9CUCU|nr:unnamed protein product [Ceutorhynchus assimilis]